MTDEIKHYGVKRRSGRYPWGSGEDPQRSKDILSKVDDLRFQGKSETEVAEALGLTTSQLRSEISWANEVRKQVLMDTIQSRYDRGESKTAIAKDLGLSEGSVRNYLLAKDKAQSIRLDKVAETLKDKVDEYGYLDVGVGVERQMGISRTKLNAAINKLKEDEGYYQHEIYVKRLSDKDKFTTVKVLTKEDDLEMVKANSDKIRPVDAWTEDGGLTFKTLGPIEHLDWDRVEIRYGDKGGAEKDGLMEMRRGVKDLDLGESKYAQVRIGVGETHYLKGMAMYADDLPDGKDIIFNTNKPSGTPREKVLKPLKDSEFNPFGTTISRQKGALNIVNEEGDWNTWQTTLSAQMLSKQPTKLIRERLDATLKQVKEGYDEIESLTNPIVKKHLLEAYASGLDSKALHLKAQGLPKTKSHVILPFPDMKATEVYAPNYNDGERVVLVRYPHGGIFELPELTVNNKGPAKKLLGNAIDAIGIHPSVAEKMSGADFDGDTVYVIPNNDKKIKVSRSLKELKNFDPHMYAVDHQTITPGRKQTEMGIVSNLITDMTIKGAKQGEIARAVRHSMVVIDSEKHKLDYKQSAIDNGIAALQKKYQTYISPYDNKQHTGASTLISLSKRKVDVGGKPVEFLDEKSGKMVKKTVGGKKVPLTELVNPKLLSSGTVVEDLYADYINNVRAISNTAKKEMESIAPIKMNKEASKKYRSEVDSLNIKLNEALLNAPRERQAQLQSKKLYYENLDYDMDKDQKKKLKSQVLAEARVRVGAKRSEVEITDKEWEAIQAGAISNNKLEQILRNADMDKVKKLATPRETVKLSSAKTTRARTLLDKGYTYAEVSDALGISVSTIRRALEE